MATLEKAYRRERKLLAKPEGQSGSIQNAVGGYMASDTTNWPIGYPKGLLVTNASNQIFVSYLGTPLTVPLSGTWTDDTDVDSSNVTDDTIDGTLAKKFSIAAAHAAGDLIATQVISSTDYSGADFGVLYIKPSIDLAAGDLQIGMSATVTLGGSPVFDDVPAIKADTWNVVAIPVATLPAATISVGFKQIVDKGAYSFKVGLWRCYTAVTGTAAVGILKEDVPFNTSSNNVGNVAGTAYYKASVLNKGVVYTDKVLGLDSGALTDIGGVKSENDTILTF